MVDGRDAQTRSRRAPGWLDEPGARRSLDVCLDTKGPFIDTNLPFWQSANSHVSYHRIPELRALYFLRAFHLSSEIVGHRLRRDRAVHPFDDQISRLRPSHVAEHHLA